ncbi:MAG: YdcP family protein [Oscillospiraceae bacterium]|nr:YdcP family protein [Oscillospiraceae bacterium]
MALHFVVPKMKETFGTLEFSRYLGEQRRRNPDGTFAIMHRYALLSTVQVGDEVIVDLPEKAGKKGFPFRTKVQLTKPKIRAVGQAVGDNAHRSYEMTAENMTKVGV